MALFGCDTAGGDSAGDTSSGDRDASTDPLVDPDPDSEDAQSVLDTGLALDEADAEVPRDPLVLPTCEELLGGLFSPAEHQVGANTTPAFGDVTEHVGLPTMYGVTASWGDINSDGFVDVFVPGWVAEPEYRTSTPPERFDSIFLGCGPQFFEHRIEVWGDRPGDWPNVSSPAASHIADMDADGVPDLLVSVLGSLYVWYQRPLGFESTKVWQSTNRNAPIVDLTVADFNLDGLLDVYGSVYGAANVLLEGTPVGPFVNHGADNPEHARSTNVETFASAFIPRRDPSLAPLLYLAHHAEPDQVWLMGPEFSLELSIDNIPPNSSMGVDYFYPATGSGVVAAISEEGDHHFIYRVEEGFFEPAHLEQIFPGRITEWGVRFSDFNNDGGMDLVYACAPTGDPQTPLDETAEYYMKIAVSDPETENAGEFRWSDVSSQAGPLFEGGGTPNHYGLGAADFDLDGCVDLLITPKVYEFNNPGRAAYFGPITILRNRCEYPGNWVGFLLEDPGALVSAEVNYRGEFVHRWADSQAGSSVGGESASEQLHIGLGQTDTIERVEVRCRDGQTTQLDRSEITLNAYNDIRHLCSPAVP